MSTTLLINKRFIWSILNRKFHPTLEKEETEVGAFIPLIKALFPGIEFFSITGFYKVMQTLVFPALKKTFPEIEGLEPEKISIQDMSEIAPFLESDRYEWTENSAWKNKFDELLVA